MVDQKTNLGQVNVSTGYDASATSITLSSGQGATLPDPAGDNYNLAWFDATNHSVPSQDGNWEIVRVTAKAGDVLTVTRAQEGTSATTKNTAAAQYVMYNSWTEKDAEDINTALGTKLENISEDTTPQLGGEMDAGAHSIGFTNQTATGDGTTTIDWKLGNKFAFTFGAFNEIFTFTAPTKPGNFLLKLVQDATGSRTATWPATVKWPGGTAPTLTTTAATGTDIISLYWDGTNYFGTSSADFS